MSFKAAQYLRHMLDEAEFLARASAGLQIEEFLQNPIQQRAFVRSLEVIGEAAKKLDPDFRMHHPEVDWRAMAGMRDKLIHGYFGVDYELVWDVVKTHVPDLESKLTRILGLLQEE